MLSKDESKNKKIFKTIGSNVRAKRLQRNMSRKDLAKLLGISVSFLGYIEKGLRGVTAENLYKLSHIFEDSIDSFFIGFENVLRFNEEVINQKRVNHILDHMFTHVEAEDLDKMITLLQQVKKLRGALR